jgi:hypothetical protein
MTYFIFETSLFAIGLLIFLFGRLPLTPNRTVRGSPAYLIGVLLMIPLGVYLIACRETGLSPLGWESLSRTDPYQPMTGGFLRLAAMASAFGCLLMATVLAIIASETKRRD